MIDPVDDPLAARLKAMALPVPPSLIPRVLASAKEGRRPLVRRWRAVRLVAGAVMLLLFATATGSYFAPRFAQGLAEAPIVNSALRLLQDVGLVGIVERMTSFNDVATSSGFRVRLLGGYADSFQTVLILHFDDPNGLQPSVLDAVTLTDQFGRSYERQAHSWTAAQPGGAEQALTFAPIGWPGSWVGTRLTLRINGLQTTPPNSRTVTGRWVLHGALALQDTHRLPLPAAGRVDATTFRFIAVQTSPATIQVKIEIVGPLASKVRGGGHIAGPAKPQPGLTIELIDPSGLAQMVIGGSMTITDAEKVVVDWRWVAASKGRYQLVVTLSGEERFKRAIDVP